MTSTRARLSAATERDVVATTRDSAALARDVAADARDLTMTERDAGRVHHDPGAARQRRMAAQDRSDAAADGEQAAWERVWARADREALAGQLAVAETDALTGARTRSAGLADLDREIDRCGRNHTSLIVAYVDVVGLKALNDAAGHAAGDHLLTRVVDIIERHLRPYDLMIRVGGDEFLFAMSGMTLTDARVRFAAIATALAAEPGAHAITTGFAALTPGETVTALVARADRELGELRRVEEDSRPGA